MCSESFSSKNVEITPGMSMGEIANAGGYEAMDGTIRDASGRTTGTAMTGPLVNRGGTVRPTDQKS